MLPLAPPVYALYGAYELNPEFMLLPFTTILELIEALSAMTNPLFARLVDLLKELFKWLGVFLNKWA